jgi:hypothetical protein
VQPFGNEVQRCQRELKEVEDSNTVTSPQYETEVTKRAVNNVVHEEIRALGGRDALLAMVHPDSMRAKRCILAGVRKELRKLRVEIELLFTEPDTDPQELTGVMDDLGCGQGHLECERAMNKSMEGK